MTLEASDPYAGHYVRAETNEFESAEIDLTPLPDAITGGIRYFVSGFALGRGRREAAPPTGSLEFYAELRDGTLTHTFHRTGREHGHHRVIIQLAPDGFTLDEVNELGSYGFGVTFAGDYKRTEKLDYTEQSDPA